MLIWAIIMAGGVFLIQDGLASIVFYPNEKWAWNHAARLVRVAWGIAFVILAVMGLIE